MIKETANIHQYLNDAYQAFRLVGLPTLAVIRPELDAVVTVADGIGHAACAVYKHINRKVEEHRGIEESKQEVVREGRGHEANLPERTTTETVEAQPQQAEKQKQSHEPCLSMDQ